MSGAALADQLMAELGYHWEATPEKTQFPDEQIAYYHLVKPDTSIRLRFTTMADLVNALRAEVRERRASLGASQRGRKPLAPDLRRQQIRWFVAPETIRILEAYAQPDEPLGNTLDRYVTERQ